MEHNEEIAKLRTNIVALADSMTQHYGTMTALQMVLMSLIETHPAPSVLLAKLALRLELAESHFLAESLSESALAKFQETSKIATDLCSTTIAKQYANK